MSPTRHSQSSRKSSPYPSVDSASEYSPEAQPDPNVSTGVKRRSRSGLTPEERREARAHRNRIAAQCSRDRKKAQFAELTARVAELEAENRALRLGVQSGIPQLSDASIVQENAALKVRVQQLELAWQNMAKLIGSMPLIQAQPSDVLRPQVQPLLSLPLSPAPTTLSAPESLETPAEPTCESAAGGSLGTAISTQVAHGAEPDWLAMFTSPTSDVKTPGNSSSAHHPLLLTDIDSLISTAALDQGSQEMERLLNLLPTQDGPLESAATAPLDLAALGAHDDWSWLTNDTVF